MPISITEEIDDKSLADADQTDADQADEGVRIGMMASYEEGSEEEEAEFTKADFERDLRKVSRKIKR